MSKRKSFIPDTVTIIGFHGEHLISALRTEAILMGYENVPPIKDCKVRLSIDNTAYLLYEAK